MNQLTEDQLKQIERDAEMSFPDTLIKEYGKNDVMKIADVVHFQRKAYTAAATKYLQRIKDLEDGLRELIKEYELTVKNYSEDKGLSWEETLKMGLPTYDKAKQLLTPKQ